MATWGSETWGYENWGTLGDVNVTLSGQSTTSSLGSVEVQSVPGWGTQYWGAGEWGDLKSPEVALTGQELTSTTATVTAITDVTVELTGEQLGPIIIGDYVEGISVEAFPTGEELNSTVNSVFAGELVVVEVTSPADDPWGNTLVGWGNGHWGVGDGISLLGDAVTEAQTDVAVTLTGQELQSTAAQVVAGISILVELTNGSENVVEFTAYNQAQLSTAQQKFGTASLLLDGTNDYVESNSNVDLSSGDFTIDVWIRPNSVTGYKGIWQSGTSTTEQSYLLGNRVYWTVNPSTIITTAVTLNANEWTMLSYERQGNTHRIYKNGTLADTATTGNKQDNGPFNIGENGFGDFNGYIDEFRLSDIARYGGSSFTEPTGAFLPDSNTTFLLHMDGANGSTNIVDDAPGVTIARFDIGEHFAGEVVEVQVTTASTQAWGALTWGDGQWGQSVGTDISQGGEEVAVPSIEVDVTGEELQTNTGEETVTGTANVTLTGLTLLDIQLGDEDAFTNVRVNVTGQELGPFIIGDFLAGISAEADPTGVTTTTSTGIMSVNAWAVVDAGDEPTWTVVDIAA